MPAVIGVVCVSMLRIWFWIILFPLFGMGQPTKVRKIVLDAGHGGHDPGCIGAIAREKDITLSIALQCGQLIKQGLPDVEVIYTRTKDEFVPLHERARLANQADADLFISVHCNASRSKTAYGSETYVMGLHKTEENLEVAMRENSVVELEDNFSKSYGGFDPRSPEGFIVLAMHQNDYLERSILLASLVEEQFHQSTRKSRGIKQAGFLVLWQVTMPGVLIEVGFLTNREEEKFLASPQAQQQLARDIFIAIKRYKEFVEGLQPAEQTSTTAATVPKEPSAAGAASAAIDSSTAVTYRIQLYASVHQLEASDERFRHVLDALIIERTQQGTYRYMVGEFITVNEARKRLQYYKSQGYPDAFVVAYQNGKRIPL